MGPLPALRRNQHARHLYLIIAARYLLIASTLVVLAAAVTLSHGIAVLGAVFACRSVGALLGSLVTGAVSRRVHPQRLFALATAIGAACRGAALLALLAGLPWPVVGILGLVEQAIERFAYVQLQIGVTQLMGTSALVGLGSMWALCWALGSSLAGGLAALDRIDLLVAVGVAMSVGAGALAWAHLPDRPKVPVPAQRGALDQTAWRLTTGSPVVPVAAAFVVALLAYGPLNLEVGLTTDLLGPQWLGLGAGAFALGALGAPALARRLPRGSREIAWWLLLGTVCAASWALLEGGVLGLVAARAVMGASVYAVEGRLNASVVSRQNRLGGSTASGLSAVTAALTGGSALSSLLAGRLADHLGGVGMALVYGGVGLGLVLLVVLLRPAAYRQMDARVVGTPACEATGS